MPAAAPARRTRRITRGVLQNVVTAFVSALVAAAIVHGADGVDTTQIRACVNDANVQSPNVRIISESASCVAGETTRTWNVQGPVGPIGVTGATGAVGATGPIGLPPTDASIGTAIVNTGLPDGLFKTVRRSSQLNSSASKILVARCPSTHPKVLSGGFETDPKPWSTERQFIAENGPAPLLGERGGWKVDVFRLGAGALGIKWKLVATAECTKAG